MTVVPLRTQFVGVDSVLELATRLGRECLLNGSKLMKLDAQEALRPFSKVLEDVVTAIDQELWLHPPDEDFTSLLAVDGLGEWIELVEANSPLEYLAVLRGLFPVLRRFYDEVETEVRVRSGTPLAVATRRVNDLFSTTPSQETVRLNDLLRLTDEKGNRLRSGLYLADFGMDDRVPVVLDFSHRHRLDELTWSKEKRLPRIATLHPCLGKKGIVVGEKTESTFFDVRPRNWDHDGVVRQLRDIAAEVEVAVLPELSLTPSQMDALEQALAAEPASFPPLVVAGSAHLSERNEDDELVRANESRIYLDGHRVASHRKIQAFLLRAFEGKPLSRPLLEGITHEEKPITILSGDRTRLAVAICADIIDSRLPGLLQEAGVNVLLVPSLTVSPGSFNGDACLIASKSQGVTVIVNGDSAALIEEGEPPFMVMVGVPRPRAGEQSREYDRPTNSDPPYTGFFDPNLPLHAEREGDEEAFQWR
jgi:hypothetical protein